MIQNFLDYHKYLFKIRPKDSVKLIIDLGIFILSFTAFIKQVDNRLSLIILIAAILKMVYDTMSMIEQIKAHMNLRYGEMIEEMIEYNKIKLSKYEVNNEYEFYYHDSDKGAVKTPTKNSIITSEKIDRYLRENEVFMEEAASEEKKIRDFIKNNKEQLMKFLQWQYRVSRFYGKMFFNEEKFCLSSDISSVRKVGYHKGSYYDTYLTNQICGKQLKSNQDDSVLADASWMFPLTKDIKNSEESYIFKDISNCCMNNEVGISTIAITKDNYIVIHRQNRLAQSSSGLLVPTGSGSCDWSDIKGNSLTQTVIGAMNRELWEENGKERLAKKDQIDDIGETKLIGFFRWFIKGGKPEFVGVTKLKKNLVDIKENNEEIYEGFSEYLLENNEKKLKPIIRSIRENGKLSVPLMACLLSLERFIDEYDKAEEFLFSEE